ncbi:MAG: Kelch repeat-containing protein [Planctomycetota bacterium]
MKTKKTTKERKRKFNWILAGLILSVLLGISSPSLGAGHTWTQKADMPTARSCLSTSVANGKIYAIGGMRNTSSEPLSTVEEYDPNTDTWTTKANMPNARISHGACVIEGKIYVIGGGRSVMGAGSTTVARYDPETDTWTRKANMPTSRFVLSASVVNGKIYAIGGKPAHNATPLKTVEEYDPATDTWMRKAPMPTARFGLSTCVVDGKIYAIGGDPGSYVGLSTVEEYDPTTDTWTRKADMLTVREFLSVSVLDGRIYAFGGASTLSGTGLSFVDEYDPATDTWTRKSDMPTPRLLLSTSVVNSRIYAIGGSLSYPWNGVSTVEQYDIGSPSPDFNGDGIVDIKDLLTLIESWGQDDPLVDIAPGPFGDGVVDAMDLELLMSCWEQPVDDPTLIAHWALDEIEGDTAYDSAGINDALVIGNPAWMPRDGQVQGAIQLDGIDDCTIATSVLNPARGPFSVFAWIKGGVPGQVVISGPISANWLCTDILTGNLMTELKGSGRSGKPLQSQTVVTDGNWHCIGFVWDGSYRTLYVDDIAVAEDTQDSLEYSDGGLYIGTGKAMEPGTFWSGLIDDVRIYNRAVNP